MSLFVRDIDAFFFKSIFFSILFLVLTTGCKKQEKKEIHAQDVQRINNFIFEEKPSSDTLLLLLKESEWNNDNIGKALYNKELGRRLRDESRFTEAIAHHQEGLRAAIFLQDTLEIAQALNCLGTDFRRIGSLAEASDYHYQALNISEAYSGSETPAGIKNKVMAMNGIGNICLYLRYYDEAEYYFREALKDEVESNSYLGQAINYANIGAIFEERTQYDSAHMYYSKSLEMNKKIESDMGMGLCYISLGHLHEINRAYILAEEDYQKAFDLMAKISDKWHWLESCLAIARIKLLNGQNVDFQYYIKMAGQTATEINSPEHLAKVYKLKHDFNKKQGDYRLALDNYEYSKMMEDSVANIERENRYMDIRVNYEREKNARTIHEIQRVAKTKQRENQLVIYSSWIIATLLLIVAASLFYGYKQGRKRNKMLKELNNIRSTFFTNITHEFRTPITVILGLNERMQKQKNLPPKEIQAFQGVIQRQGNSLLNLVNQLLDISKLKSGIDIPEWRHGDIVIHLSMITESFRLYAREKNIYLNFVAQPKEIIIDFVPSYIQKIVSNLLSNAIKYSRNGDDIVFSIEYDNEKELLSLNVVDKGEGIPEKDLKNIFKMFYQSPEASTKSGTGVGLSLTYLLVKNLKGGISVESQQGKGSSFLVTLPAKYTGSSPILPWIKQDDIPILEDFDKIEDFSTEILSPNRPTILLVEDNEDVAYYVRTLLSDNYNVIYAADGQEGFDKAIKFIPDLVITDLMMPIKDGMQLCEDMKASHMLNHIPIIMLTAKTTDEDRIAGFRCGAEAYISKPFHSEELMICIEKILENRRLLKEKYRNTILQDNGLDVSVTGADVNIDFLRKVTDFIYEEMRNPNLTGALIADHVAMSVSQLNRKLTAIGGMSSSAYIVNMRLKQAKKLLAKQQKAIAEVAENCGFYDTAYFSRIFKKHVGCTPSQYQRVPSE